MRIAIIGGGWAGLACAERLIGLRPTDASLALPHARSSASSQTGLASPFQVTLFESAPTLGGRARGLIWQLDSGKRIAIDNGQHLTIGAYTETFALLSRCGIAHWPSWPLVWSGVSTGGRVAHRWQIPDAAWPWRALAGLMPPYAPAGWPWAWRRSLAATLVHLVRNRWQPESDDQTAQQWFERLGVPGDLMDHFWRPLIEGALNTELEAANAHVTLRVLKDSMAGASGATRVWLPPSDLSTDGVDPIAQSLQERGLKIRSSHQVLRVHADGRLDVRHSDQVTTHVFDAVVLACPHHASLRLWHDSMLALGAPQRRWQSLEHRAITTIWVALDASAKKAVSRLPQWFILNRARPIEHIAQVAVKRNDAIAFVISAQRLETSTRERQDASPSSRDQAMTPSDLREALGQQIAAQLHLDIRALPQKWITEKRATWACTSSAPLASADEALGYTGEGRIFRAADDLEPGYPATIESAVRSGRRTAATVMKALVS